MSPVLSCELPSTPKDHCAPVFSACDPLTYDNAVDNTLRSGYVPVDPPGAAPLMLVVVALLCVTCVNHSGVNGRLAIASIAG